MSQLWHWTQSLILEVSSLTGLNRWALCKANTPPHLSFGCKEEPTPGRHGVASALLPVPFKEQWHTLQSRKVCLGQLSRLWGTDKGASAGNPTCADKWHLNSPSRWSHFCRVLKSRIEHCSFASTPSVCHCVCGELAGRVCWPDVLGAVFGNTGTHYFPLVSFTPIAAPVAWCLLSGCLVRCFLQMSKYSLEQQFSDIWVSQSFTLAK